MRKYRIRINVLNNGEKEYIPQVGTPSFSLGKYINLKYKWRNITRGYIGNFNTCTSKVYYYDSEEKAMEIIESYKDYLSKKEGDEINKTIYKEL